MERGLAVRVIAGIAKGRRLEVPKSGPVRPTADRVKETIFNILGQWFDGDRVLDLYAGVGGLGIEALSRGAGHVTFVEKDKHVMSALVTNLENTGFSSHSTTLFKPVDRAVRQLGSSGAKFQLVFADPPYALRETPALIAAIAEAGLVSEGGRVVIEHDRREAVPEASGRLVRVDERRFGDTMVTFYEQPALAG